MNKKQVIKRLRASKEASDQKQAAAGAADGRRWAQQRAQYPELERLADCRLLENLDSEEPSMAGYYIFSIIDPVEAEVPGADTEFWEMNIQSALAPTGKYFATFLSAAIDVWYEVRDQVIGSEVSS